MARPLRVEFPGAIYHITSRGNRRNSIFFDDEDRLAFNEELGTIIKIFNWRCYAFVQMTNHYHLLIETPESNLSKGMKDLNGNYAQKFNISHGQVGHLFEGRYQSRIIEKDPHLLEVARYIVLNPVRANMVNTPEKWRWSSYRATAGLEPAPSWLDLQTILGFFSSNAPLAQGAYIQFVAHTSDSDHFQATTDGSVIGSQQFKDWIAQRVKPTRDVQEYPKLERFVGRPTLEDLFQGTETNLSERNEAIRIARFSCGYSVTEIAVHLQLANSTVSEILHEENRKPKT